VSTVYTTTIDGTPGQTIDFGFLLARNPWYNVMDYGALGNGVNDDTAAINNAVAAASAGGIVFLPPGTYKLTGSGIALNQPNVILRGAGMKASTLLAPVGNANAITVSAPDNIIEDLAVNGQYFAQANNGSQDTQVGIFLATGADRLMVHRCFIYDTCGHGISSINHGADLRVETCLITNAGIAASAVQAIPAATSTVFAVSPGAAQSFVSGQSILIGTQAGSVQSVQSIVSQVAVVTSASVFGVNVSDGTLFSPGQVIHAGGQAGTILSIAGDTITLMASLPVPPTPGQIVAIDNITLATPLASAPPAGAVVAVTGGYLKGVYVTGAARPVIRHSTFTGWSQAIGLWYGVTDALVEGNSLVNNYGYEDAAHTINRSALEVFPSDNVGGNSRVIANVIDGSTHDCIECAEGEVGTVFCGNTLRNWAAEAGLGNTGIGLELTGQNTVPGGTTEIIVLGNTFYSNGACGSTGLQVNGYTSRVKIEGNQFNNFNSNIGTSYAVFIASGDPPIIVANSFNSCSYSVWVNSTAVATGVISANSFWNLPTAFASRAINLAAAGDGWLIEQNCVDCDPVNGGLGIVIASGNQHRVIGNRIRAVGPIVISMNDGLVLGNVCLKGVNDGVGAIRVENASLRNVVRDNAVTNTGGYTISIEGTSDYNQVGGNQFPTSVSVNGDVRITTTATHNTVDSNSQNGIFVSQSLRLLPAVPVGTAQVTVAHGLGYAPAQVLISMTSAGSIHRSAASDTVNIYLTADASSRSADVFVR